MTCARIASHFLQTLIKNRDDRRRVSGCNVEVRAGKETLSCPARLRFCWTLVNGGCNNLQRAGPVIGKKEGRPILA